MDFSRALACIVAAAAVFASGAAGADDALKVTIGQRGNWDSAVVHLGMKAGIFQKHGVDVESVYTSGSGETLQPVISGSVDLGIAVGTLGAIAAYAKGGPVRIIGAQATGAADYWYAKATSPIRSLKDTDGRTIAFSTNGSSTYSVVLAFIKEFGLAAKPTATGNPSSTLTAVMTDQVDVGWASPPFGLKEMNEGKIRLIARATDASIVRGRTVRVVVANAQALAQRAGAISNFMQAYRETIDHMYGDDPRVIKDYAEFVGVPEPLARRVRDEFFPKSLIWPDEIKGLDSLMEEAVVLKFVAAPLNKDQTAELISIPGARPWHPLTDRLAGLLRYLEGSRSGPRGAGRPDDGRGSEGADVARTAGRPVSGTVVDAGGRS